MTKEEARRGLPANILQVLEKIEASKGSEGRPSTSAPVRTALLHRKTYTLGRTRASSPSQKPRGRRRKEHGGAGES
eukprot:695753-Pyramimonas_sp.AAC.1